MTNIDRKQMKKMQDNQGQVKLFLQKSRTIHDSFENPGHFKTFQDSGHHETLKSNRMVQFCLFFIG